MREQSTVNQKLCLVRAFRFAFGLERVRSLLSVFPLYVSGDGLSMWNNIQHVAFYVSLSANGKSFSIECHLCVCTCDCV